MTTPTVPVKGTKAWVAAVGSTLTAAQTVVTTVAIVVGDDAIDANEVGGVVTTLITFALTVYGVWKVRNEPK